jgi:hypothetical protein
MLKDTTLTPLYMPTPNPSESRDDFIDRCMGDDKMVNEFDNPAQRAAVCNSYYDEKSASEEYEDWGVEATAAEYQGRKVTLNKPFRTPGKNKKFGVYTRNESGTVVIAVVLKQTTRTHQHLKKIELKALQKTKKILLKIQKARLLFQNQLLTH